MSARPFGFTTSLVENDDSLAAEQRELLARIRHDLARTVHEVNNPLAIISGNAQLLAELTRVMDLDPEICIPILDIEQATRDLADRLSALALLKEDLLQRLDEADTL